LRSIDDIPYALVGTAIGAMCFFLGNLVFFKSPWQLALAPVVGAVLGYVAGIAALRDKKLPSAATMGQMKGALKDKIAHD